MVTRLPGWASLIAVTGLALACSTPSSAGAPAASTNRQSGSQSAQANPAAQNGESQVLNIATGDYYFRPDEIGLRRGSVTVSVLNEGPRRHTFYVRNLADTDDIVKGNDRLVAGETETVTFTLPTAGRYKMYCAIPGHADRGEIGWLVVSS